MREVGVKELKASLSKVLREVRDGTTVRVTSRGRHVADLVPPESPVLTEHEQRLVDEGTLTLPRQRRRLGPPPRAIKLPVDSAELISEGREERF